MTARVFNVALFIGWVLTLAGGILIHPGAGLAASGLELVALTLFSARLSGGLYVSGKPEGGA